MTYSLYGTTENGSKIHVLMSSGYYIGQVRQCGYRKYETVTGKCKTLGAAIAKASKHFKGNHRLRVIYVDHNPYYEPSVAFEGKRE